MLDALLAYRTSSQTRTTLIPYLAYGDAIIPVQVSLPLSSRIVGIFFTPLSHLRGSLTDLRSKLSILARPTSIIVFIVQKGLSTQNIFPLVYLHVKREILHKCHIQHLTLFIQWILHQCHFVVKILALVLYDIALFFTSSFQFIFYLSGSTSFLLLSQLQAKSIGSP